MINFLENYGMEELLTTEDIEQGFTVQEVIQKGKYIPGYKGISYYFKSMGDVEFWAKLESNEDNSKSIIGVDAHCAGSCLWELQRSQIELKGFDTGAEDVIMFEKLNEEGGLLPINVINSAVHPGLLAGDRVKLQVIGHPSIMHYYADNDAYEDSVPKEENGEHYIVAVGSLLPICFLNNHSLNKEEEERETDTDLFVTFAGEVKQVYHGVLEIEGEQYNQFIRCTLDTNYGPFELVHSIDQIDESEHKNIKPGAIVSGVCVISGDVVINEYIDGIIKDLEHNLMLLRYVIAKGEPERLRGILDKDVVYETDSYGTSYTGIDGVIDRFKHVNENRSAPYFVHMATITKIDSNLKYDVDTRCLILASDEINNFESIMFIEVNEEGLITKIKVSTNGNYHFKIDKPEYLNETEEQE